MAIEHKRLGNHGVLVSHICLGTMNFGWHTTQEESFKVMAVSVSLSREEWYSLFAAARGAPMP